ncbi:MAG: cold shock domain-containing protein [Gemmatimonadetes bacterium]|nr:cold shock domain-containing protein [Gemmatimonadota bacterium]
MQGVVKVYDPTTGIGIIRGDDGDEVQLRPGSLEGSFFRMLRQGQRVIFDASEVDGALVAGNLRFGADGN